MTTPGDKRSFDMRPSASKDTGRNPYDRHTPSAGTGQESLLDPDPSE
jgi:hypothetical protein